MALCCSGKMFLLGWLVALLQSTTKQMSKMRTSANSVTGNHHRLVFTCSHNMVVSRVLLSYKSTTYTTITMSY